MEKIDPTSISNRLATLLAGFFILMLLTTVGVQAEEQNIRDPREFFFTQSFGDLPDELQTAREHGKKGLFLFFEAEGCPYCTSMLKRVLNQKQVQEWYRERFLSIAIDIHGDVELTDFDGITLPSKVFAEQRKAYMTPMLSFLDLNGTEIYRHMGAVKTVQEFLLMGEYIADGHYFDTEYSVFAKARGLLE